MQKFGLLLAFAALAGFSQAADPTYTWWNGQDDSMNVSASTTGTWTIGMNLNMEALRNLPTDTNYSDNGKALFTFTGSGNTHSNNPFDRHPDYSNRNVTVTMGWGGDWYATKKEDGTVNDSAGNGVYAGLQLGVASTKNPADLSSCNGWSSGFEVYRADMKVQNGGVHGGDNGTYDWSIDEVQNSTVTTLDDIVSKQNVKQATLFVEHTYAAGPSDQLADNTHRDYASDSGDYASDITYTTFYLTVITEDEAGNTVTYNYMGQYDDKSTVSSASEGSRLGGSAHYDVDMIQSITGLNNGMIEDTDFVFVNSALTSAQREALMGNGLPEPTTATMSLLALATLAARRRRQK